MVFNLLISIVFIAELIITAAILLQIRKLDKAVLLWNEFLSDIKPNLSEILETFRKISEQMIEAAPIFINVIKDFFAKLVVGQLKGILTGLTFWLVKKEVEKRIN